METYVTLQVALNQISCGMGRYARFMNHGGTPRYYFPSGENGMCFRYFRGVLQDKAVDITSTTDFPWMVVDKVPFV